MRRIEVPEAEADQFLAENLRYIQGRAEQSAGEKKVEGSKKFVLDWLKTHRDLDISTLPLGEIVIVQVPRTAGLRDCFQITRKSGGNKIDVKLIEAFEPETANRFRRQFINTNFDAVPQA